MKVQNVRKSSLVGSIANSVTFPFLQKSDWTSLSLSRTRSCTHTRTLWFPFWNVEQQPWGKSCHFKISFRFTMFCIWVRQLQHCSVEESFFPKKFLTGFVWVMFMRKSPDHTPIIFVSLPGGRLLPCIHFIVSTRFSIFGLIPPDMTNNFQCFQFCFCNQHPLKQYDKHSTHNSD